MLKQMSLFVALSFLAAACGGGGTDSKKKVGPSDPKGLAQKPSNATPMGMTTSLKAPNGAGPALSTAQPGDTGDAMFCWEEDIDEDGSPDDCCVVEDDETGDIALACAPFTDECDDGSELSGALLLTLEASGSGTFALAGSNICDSGYDLFGCDFDADGEIGACGACSVVGTELECEEVSEEEEEEEEEEI